MSVQVLHANVHTPEQVREIIDEAIKIADGVNYRGTLWDAVFAKACDLLGQRTAIVQQDTLPAPQLADLLTRGAKG